MVSVCLTLGLPGGLVGKKPPAMQDMQEMWVPSLGQEDPLEKGMATYSSILVWGSPMDRGAWRAMVHRVAKSWTLLKWLSKHACTCIGWWPRAGSPLKATSSCHLFSLIPRWSMWCVYPLHLYALSLVSQPAMPWKELSTIYNRKMQHHHLLSSIYWGMSRQDIVFYTHYVI